MSNLVPETREEEYYDAILNRRTSDLPTPQTRQEEYLCEIAKSISSGQLEADTVPTQGSDHYVTSDGIYTYINTMITQAITAAY